MFSKIDEFTEKVRRSHFQSKNVILHWTGTVANHNGQHLLVVDTLSSKPIVCNPIPSNPISSNPISNNSMVTNPMVSQEGSAGV